ncbi:hypothetical protein Poli38472_004595 [Pythium oligandrum]|uniref:Sterol 3-beta-glucosyltransferase n=1 Tax=Pythium oligandrum TaxID=41045 RepID=A0A8K1CA68_PYTOL|nr:hypothetical protein Poli38472_004595 [Pythium oligandrum]|eukprot:TMW59526.1 hypothetical protein Poli38472_004595 [Pythium oligandrum]
METATQVPFARVVEAPRASETHALYSQESVEAMALFDKNGRIQLDFDGDDEEYDISVMQEQLKVVQSVQVPAPSLDDEIVPRMNVCIMIVGTRGDVQPFIGIAKRLQQDGHRVRLATHAVYRDFVMEHGVEFYPLGGDPKELAAYMVKTGGHIIPLKMETLMNDVPRNVQMIDEILNSTWPAVSAADPDGNGKGIPGRPFQANAIISNPVTYGHIHVAERLGVPLHIMFPQPWVPTTVFPHPMANMAYDGRVQKRNYVSYKMVDLLMWQGTESMVNKFRSEVLGLRKIRKGGRGRDILLDLAIPHAFMWSPALVPKPHDWGHIYDVIGTVQLKGVGSSYHPTPELETFLGNDGGPIFVGFGSMILSDPAKTTKMIIEAATQANVRVLIQSSWSDMAGDIKVPSNVFFLGNCPHDWLMPRVSAVVHHGGAGTTAAGLLAGKPTFIVPFFGDQPFWGRAVVKAGVGVEPCPIGDLTTEKLRTAFVQLMDPEMRHRTLALAEVMSQENGVEGAVQSFYRHLPLKHMRCDIDGVELATKWSMKDRIKMCDECEFVISSRPENSLDDIIQYHCVDYSARGPQSVLEGAAAGAGAFMHELVGGWKDIVAKPAEGYRDEGAKGAVIGLAKGVMNGVFIRPIYGGVLFADQVVTGRRNKWRASNERNYGSVIFDNKNLRRIVQKNAPPPAHTADMKGEDDVHFGRRKSERDRDRVPVQLTPEERLMLEAKFYEVINKVYSSSDSIELTQTPTLAGPTVEPPSRMVGIEDDSQSLRFSQTPSMNICLMTTGSWNDGVQQFVAIGLRLKADGHRVRLATHEFYRDRVLRTGLEFYPVGGQTYTIQSYLLHSYGRENGKQGLFRLSKLKQDFPWMQDLRELVFSLWPACVEGDPLNPGLHFRADAIITHPLMFGQTIVAERLGVPLHCVSTSPWSRTKAFPSLLSPSLSLAQPYRYDRANLETYDSVHEVHCTGIRDILDGFRSSLGLLRKSKPHNHLAEWNIPHTYLWNEELLSRPADWSNDITIAGPIEWDDQFYANQDAEIVAFVTENASSVIYVGIERETWDPETIRRFSSDLEQAAIRTNIRVVFQVTDQYTQEPLRRSSVLMQIASGVPIKHVLPCLAGAIHWGDATITSSCAAAGVPACVIARNSIERFWGTALTLAGAGIEALQISQLSQETFINVFQALQNPLLVAKTQQLRQYTISSEAAINRVVQSFYANLPLEAMTCDLDPTRIARIYDQVNDLKLSYEAQLVVQSLTDQDDRTDVKYKPLKYSQSKPPRYSLRRLDSYSSRYTPSKSTRAKDGAMDGAPSMVRKALGRYMSMAEHVIEAPDSWSSPQIQQARVTEINAAYEKLLEARALFSS